MTDSIPIFEPDFYNEFLETIKNGEDNNNEPEKRLYDNSGNTKIGTEM